MFVYIGGVPGVGKTTVIKKIVEMSRENDLNIQGLREKDILCQISSVKTAQEYANLPMKTRAEAREKMIDHFYRIDRQDLSTIRIRDDHFTAPDKNDIYWTRPLEKKDKIHMLAFVVIIDGISSILHRRINRDFYFSKSNSLDYNKTAFHQKMEIKNAFSQARHLNIYFNVIKNKEGRLAETAEKLFLFIKKVT